MKTHSFETSPIEHGVNLFFEDDDVEVYTFNLNNEDGHEFRDPGFVFFLYETWLSTQYKRLRMTRGEYASTDASFYVRGGEGIYMRFRGHRPVNQSGGPLETVGRLKYIDGCTDSLLIPPVRRGDPCLNFLHFPPHITQTQHTHPSHRVGIVVNGRGRCITPFGNLELIPGNIFIIKKYTEGEPFQKGLLDEMYPPGQHSFETYEESMDVVAWHPDSDFGPTDQEHPMINRTIVKVGEEFISASKLEDIQTK